MSNKFYAKGYLNTLKYLEMLLVILCNGKKTILSCYEIHILLHIRTCQVHSCLDANKMCSPIFSLSLNLYRFNTNFSNSLFLFF